MILHPGAAALLVSSALVSGLLLYAGWHAVLILRRWDLSSGSSLQLDLERRTYLVSTILAYALGFEIVSLFLFVYTADGLASLFTGAMCAAGSLRASRFGYPVLLLKLASSVAAGLWLVVNHVDALGEDYPLVRRKYALLLALAPLVLLEGLLQALYFGTLRPDVITSCCGSLFSRTGAGLGSDLAALPARPTAVAFYGALAVAVAAGVAIRRSGRGGRLLAAAAGLALPVGLASVVSFGSPYVYELPTHHCPFCLLRAEYGFVGYALDAALLVGAVCGMGVGAVAPFRRIPSLAAAVPRVQRRLAGMTVVLFLALAVGVAWRVQSSRLRL